MFFGKTALLLSCFAVLWTLTAGIVSYFRKLQKTWHSWSVLGVTLVLVGIFSVWVSLGVHAPIDMQYVLWKFLPMYRFLRFPSRHLILLVFAGSILTGLGLHFLRYRALQAIAVIFLLFELVPFARHFIEIRAGPESRHDTELVRIIRSDQGNSRILPNFEVWLPPRDSLDFDAASFYRIYSASGYDPSLLRNYYEFATAVNGYDTQASILATNVQIPPLNILSIYVNFLNAGYLYVPFMSDPLSGSSTPQFTLLREDSERDYRLYQNNFVYPRFFLTSSVTVLPNREAVAAAIGEGRTDPRVTILADREHITQKNIREADCPVGTIFPPVEVLSYGTNTIRLKTSSPCNAYLSTSEVFYPGWDASVDGVKAPLFEGNMAFRALWVPKGDHTIELSYVPRIFYLGGGVSLLTALMCGSWIAMRKRILQ